MFKLRIVIITLILLVTLLILYFTGNKSVQHKIIITESPEKIWKVLTDTDKYTEWNPVMELLEGKINAGNKVKYRFIQDEKNVSEIPSKVKKIIPNKLLNQGGGLPMVITFDHKYILEPKGEETQLTIHEDYRGIYVNFWNPKTVESAYKRLNEAIKERVESL